MMRRLGYSIEITTAVEVHVSSVFDALSASSLVRSAVMGA